MVSYDIPDDKRRTKVMKIIEGYGRRAQYSVFECEVRPADLRQLQERLRDVIDEQLDDVRFYALCSACLAKVLVLGKGELNRQWTHVVV
ncbi:MAG: CRISPR-associated endonuclease Cas2 [Caldilineaceae bacterium]